MLIPFCQLIGKIISFPNSTTADQGKRKKYLRLDDIVINENKQKRGKNGRVERVNNRANGKLS
jgi:hypothetical protein